MNSLFGNLFWGPSTQELDEVCEALEKIIKEYGKEDKKSKSTPKEEKSTSEEGKIKKVDLPVKEEKSTSVETNPAEIPPFADGVGYDCGVISIKNCYNGKLLENSETSFLMASEGVAGITPLQLLTALYLHFIDCGETEEALLCEKLLRKVNK